MKMRDRLPCARATGRMMPCASNSRICGARPILDSRTDDDCCCRARGGGRGVHGRHALHPAAKSKCHSPLYPQALMRHVSGQWYGEGNASAGALPRRLRTGAGGVALSGHRQVVRGWAAGVGGSEDGTRPGGGGGGAGVVRVGVLEGWVALDLGAGVGGGGWGVGPSATGGGGGRG